MFPLRVVFVWLNVFLTPGLALAADQRPHSILILDQSDISGPLGHQIFSGLVAKLNSTPGAPVAVYYESADLNRFAGQDYEKSLQQHLRIKYRGKPIGVVVPIGDSSLAIALRWRAALWPNVPIVFAQVDETTVAQLKPPPDVTLGRASELSRLPRPT